MAKTTKHTRRLDADYTEDTVGFALESFLTLLSFPNLRYSIEPFSRGKEHWLGADARLLGHMKGFKPFYMQFKRPSAYPDTSTAKIVRERKSLKLPAAPHNLYFELREKRPTHREYQHNILFRLRQRLLARNAGDAAYVCPLFLDRSSYRFHLHLAGMRLRPHHWRRSPWSIEDLTINRTTGKIDFSDIPVLREHVSIPPHAAVADAKHSYSFTDTGTDVCFHSPLALPEASRPLSQFLSDVVGPAGSDDGFISPGAATDLFHVVTEGVITDREFFSQVDGSEPNADGISRWLGFGNYLKSEYAIEQFALVHWEQ